MPIRTVGYAQHKTVMRHTTNHPPTAHFPYMGCAVDTGSSQMLSTGAECYSENKTLGHAGYLPPTLHVPDPRLRTATRTEIQSI